MALRAYTTFTLTSIALPLSVANPPGSITVALTADAGGAPGRTIESFAMTNITSTKPAIYTVISIQHPMLESYRQYWIVVRSTNAAQITWFNTLDSGSSHARLEAHRSDSEPWSVIADPYVPGVIVSGHAATGRNLALK